MGSALSSINILTKVVLESPAEKENIDLHLKKIQDHSGYMLESMSDIVWTINPVNDTFEKVIFKMKEFAADILEPMNIQYEFVQTENLSNVPLDLNQRKNLYLIFKEAINNAAKYSNCTKVNIHLSHLNGQLIMEIRDNGKGFNFGQQQSGNGLKNIKQRADELQRVATIESNNGNGTRVSVELRIT